MQYSFRFCIHKLTSYINIFSACFFRSLQSSLNHCALELHGQQRERENTKKKKTVASKKHKQIGRAYELRPTNGQNALMLQSTLTSQWQRINMLLVANANKLKRKTEAGNNRGRNNNKNKNETWEKQIKSERNKKHNNARHSVQNKRAKRDHKTKPNKPTQNKVKQISKEKYLNRTRGTTCIEFTWKIFLPEALRAPKSMQ